MTEDGNRKIARINWSINTLNRNGAVEILWEGAQMQLLVYYQVKVFGI